MTMKKYVVTSPDGRKWEVTAPDDAQQESIIEYAKSKGGIGGGLDPNRGAITKAPPESYYSLPGGTEVYDINPSIGAALIGAGRTPNQVGEGVKQLGLAGATAGMSAAGMDATTPLKAMAAQDAEQARNNVEYGKLKDRRPFETGFGENAYGAFYPPSALTTAGRIVGPAAFMGAIGASQYGSPGERTARGAADFGTGLVGGAVSEGLRKFILPVPESANVPGSVQAARRAAADKAGVNLTPSQILNSETLARREDYLARAPFSAGVMKDFEDKNRRAIASKAVSAVGESGDKFDQGVFDAANANLGKDYASLRSQTNMPISQNVLDGFNRAWGILNKGDISVGPKKEATEMLARVHDDMWNSRGFSGEQYQAWASDLASKARDIGKTNRTAASALREVEKAMDAEARSFNKGAWEATDKKMASLKMLEKPGIVNQQTGDVNIDRLANQFERQFGANWKRGQITGELADLADLARTVPARRAGSQTAERQAAGSWITMLAGSPRYLEAKAITSPHLSEYLTGGLLQNPTASAVGSRSLGALAFPYTEGEMDEKKRRLLFTKSLGLLGF